jgi:hypothetical protein
MTTSFHKPTRPTGFKQRIGFAVRKDRGSLKGKENDEPHLVFPLSDNVP